MKEVAILLLVALLLNGCGSSKPTAQSAAGGVWSADLSGGEGSASGFSFIAQFTVASSGTLSIQNFQFLNMSSCFPIDPLSSGGTVSGSMDLTENMATDAVTGSMTFTVVGNGNTLTLTSSTVTGTISGTTLSGGAATGTWSLSGGTGCTGASGSFTMSQTTS
jgi:hypothetical protein